MKLDVPAKKCFPTYFMLYAFFIFAAPSYSLLKSLFFAFIILTSHHLFHLSFSAKHKETFLLKIKHNMSNIHQFGDSRGRECFWRWFGWIREVGLSQVFWV